MTNYWIVGAMWGGTEDALPSFLERGYWYCWEAKKPQDEISSRKGNSLLSQQERFAQINKGDRLAVKKVLSIPNQEMEIRAIGIVKAKDIDEWRIYVDWLPIIQNNKGTRRIVDLKGLTASIHGPFQYGDSWIHEIFCV